MIKRKRLRRPCKKCPKMFTPSTRWCKVCDDCLAKNGRWKKIKK